ERLHHVGRAALGADAAVAMFRNAHSSAGNSQRRRRGNVKRAAGIASCATGIHQRVAPSAAEVKRLTVLSLQRCGLVANGLRKADNLLHRLARSEEHTSELQSLTNLV